MMHPSDSFASAGSSLHATEIPNDGLRAVYTEAGHWLRLCNTIWWTSAALLVPASIACIGLAIVHPEYRVGLTVASFCPYILWVAIMGQYGWSAREARRILTRIERLWDLRESFDFYSTQQSRQPERIPITFQLALFLGIIAAWFYVYRVF
jgi:hypothetical protein